MFQLSNEAFYIILKIQNSILKKRQKRAEPEAKQKQNTRRQRQKQAETSRVQQQLKYLVLICI